MASERSPLLNPDAERTIPRPDLRYSPENIIVDGNDSQSIAGEFTHMSHENINYAMF